MATPALPRAQRPRVIITTDMEVDDMNSIIHLVPYLNELDVEAFVYTSSQYHFLGDGEHTLGQVTPHYRTKGRRAYEPKVVPPEPDPAAAELTSYRPWPAGWLERLWQNEYAAALPHLLSNADGYPEVEDLLARTYQGNVAFEGDVRFETPGSRRIAEAIMDDDPRTLWLLSWGGVNTIVRALMSIAQEYQDTPQWAAVQEKVYAKVRVHGVMDGVGQDNSWLDHGQPLFPELVLQTPEFMYGGYVDAKMAQEDARALFKAPWPKRWLVDGNGPLMGRYMLYGDGKVYENEPERFQYGKHGVVDWGHPGGAPMVFDAFDFMAEGDSMTYIPLLPVGLRGVGAGGSEDKRFDTILGRLQRDDERAPMSMAALFAGGSFPYNPYVRAYQEEFAARAQWCAHDWDECNHAPVIDGVTPDFSAAAGDKIRLSACASDPDGDTLTARWWCEKRLSAGELDVAAVGADGLTCDAVVPADAATGARYVFTLAVRDDAERPLTRYAQVAVTVA